MDSRRQRHLVRAAYHEAGHLVMTYLSRYPLRDLSILAVREQGREGCCRGWLGQPQPRAGSAGPAALARWLDVEVQCLLAGGVAEARRLGRLDRQWGARDVAAATHRARWLGYPRAARGQYLAEQFALARQQLTAPVAWRALRTVAAAVLDAGELDSARARRLISSALAAEPILPPTRGNQSPAPAEPAAERAAGGAPEGRRAS